jgi:hypothetical protein
MTYTLHAWEDISGEFSEGLLLGNGASIAVDSRFSYKSLYEKAVTNNFIRPEVQKIFDEYEINDFEAILEAVENAQRVNSALLIKEKKTAASYRIVKNALIRTIQSIHPGQSAVLGRLNNATDFLRKFDVVLSLNYDLLLYWTILHANQDNPRMKFKDCFVGSGYSFKYDWEEMEKTIRGESKSILCFYPHGNLAIVRDNYGEDTKVIAGAKLLSSIVRKWNTGFSPLFVSEGTSLQKLASIRVSSYLSRVYNSVLPNVGETLVIYGTSFQRNDEHIYKALIEGNVKKVAISIHKPSNSNWQLRCKEIDTMLNKIKAIEIKFFDAESKGAWIN